MDDYLARARTLEARSRGIISRELSPERMQQGKAAPAMANGIFHVSEGPAAIMQRYLNPGLTVIPTPATTPVPLVRPPQHVNPTHERVTLADSIPTIAVQDEDTLRRIAGGENVPRVNVHAKPLPDHPNPGEFFRARTAHDAHNVRQNIGALAGAPDRVKIGIAWGAYTGGPRWGANE